METEEIVDSLESNRRVKLSSRAATNLIMMLQMQKVVSSRPKILKLSLARLPLLQRSRKESSRTTSLEVGRVNSR